MTSVPHKLHEMLERSSRMMPVSGNALLKIRRHDDKPNVSLNRISSYGEQPRVEDRCDRGQNTYSVNDPPYHDAAGSRDKSDHATRRVVPTYPNRISAYTSAN